MSVDPPPANRRLRARVGADYIFLSDTSGELLDRLGIRHRRAGIERNDIALPTQILVDTYGVMRWVYCPDTWRVRASQVDIMKAIRALGA